MESNFHCQETKAGEEIPFCVLGKMRITICTLDVCKKNNLKSYKEESQYGTSPIRRVFGVFKSELAKIRPC